MGAVAVELKRAAEEDCTQGLVELLTAAGGDDLGSGGVGGLVAVLEVLRAW